MTMETGKGEDFPRTIPGFLGYVLRKIVARRRWWLIPFWILLAALGLFLMLSGGSYLLPAVYIAF